MPSHRDDDVVPDVGFDFATYLRWVSQLHLPISQPVISSNGHFTGSGLSIADWEEVELPDLASVGIVEQMAPGNIDNS